MRAHVAPGEVADLVCSQIDTLLERWLEREDCPYDLVMGAVGFAVYALERGDAGRPLAVRVLDWLAREARPRAGELAWHTSESQLPPWQLARAGWLLEPRGRARSSRRDRAARRLLRDGIEVDRSRALLEPAVAALLAAAPARSAATA